MERRERADTERGSRHPDESTVHYGLSVTSKTKSCTLESPMSNPADGAFLLSRNLKVHMGTHMWTSTSRRGRRIFDSSVAALPSLVTSAFGLPAVSSHDAFESFADRTDMNRRRSFKDAKDAPFKDGQLVSAKIGASETKSSFVDKRDTDDKMKSDHERQVSSSSGEELPTRVANGTRIVSSCSANQFLSALSCSNAFSLNGGQQSNSLSTTPAEAFNFQTLFSSDYTSLTLSNYGNTVGSMNPFTNVSNGHSPSNMQAMLWMWRNVCSVCHKVFGSQSELEDHLKGHLVHSTSNKQTTVQNAT
ncbi:unnamed protein product [Soboliphyme baturini]|uniref:C2H2-type domain-containing protein n=1 Tax=Soboliphyme baturini TaxID=241478 RepID=A0A183IKV2_9BILA|nr:unnamed protein product [Soboliphyme baturini]